MAIDKDTVKYVANLARIELQEKELEKFSRQLHDILGFIDKLTKLDTKDIPPTSNISFKSNILREDKPSGSLSNEKALSNAPQKKGNFFVVPKVIE